MLLKKGALTRIREPSQERADNALRNLAFHHALSPTSSDGSAASGVNIPFLSPASFSNLSGGFTKYGTAGGTPTENVGSTPGTDVWGGWTDPDDDGANTDPSSNDDDAVFGPAKPLSPEIIPDPPLTPVAVPEPDTAALMLICITALGCILRRGAMPRS